MKLLHKLGHNYKWGLDAYFQNHIGDGFILCAYSISKDLIGTALSGYKKEDYLPISFLDLQFYASKASNGGSLKTYAFHPANHQATKNTEVSNLDAVIAGVQFQEKAGFKNIIVPSVYIHPDRGNKTSLFIQEANAKIKKIKKSGSKYFLTVPISGKTIREDSEVEKLLQELTDMDIEFDGYYIACEPNLETKKKISVDFNYYMNLGKILSTLKKQNFKVILGFANVDSLVFAATSEIDYVSIGTYENLRNFNIKRFMGDVKGGPSEGWYYSEKLMNFIKARQLDIIRKRGALDLIKNDENIFSDIILKEGYPWNTHRPDIHKNYLLAISRQLEKIGSAGSESERVAVLKNMIETARNAYKKLEEQGIFLDDESSNYHLPLWMTVINTPKTGIVVRK
jgi:hypothetical protein